MSYKNITIIVPDKRVLVGPPSQPRQCVQIDNLASHLPAAIWAVQINALGAVEVEYSDGRPNNRDIDQEPFEAVIHMALEIIEQQPTQQQEPDNG